MGKIVVSARIQNLSDLYAVERQALSSDDVRTIEVDDALIDTGATMLSLPKRLIEALGLKRHRERKARTPAGMAVFGIYEAVRLTVQGRDCVVEVSDIADDCPPLIGQIPLEALDFAVDPHGQRLTGNPDHYGEQMIDVF